tara:strand:+ start:7236 stop:9221 length:1986 start_codon:yes stop_codon:yes gene_type:complete
MAGKTDRTGVQYAFKKLSGRANTSNIKSDAQEVIGSNIQVGTQTIFGQDIPISASRVDFSIYSASNGGPATAEYVIFTVSVITGTTYDADSATGGGGDGSQSSGPHGYKLFLTGNYEALSSNPKKGSSPFTNGSLVHESLGRLQLIPPNFSQDAPNPYILKIYEADAANANEIGDEIPLLDEVDWTFDYYNGILFLQDYDANKIPAYARGFIYIGDYLSASIGSGGGGGSGGGDGAASYVVMSATGSLSSERVLTAGSGINVADAGAGSTVTLSVHDSVVATISGSTFTGVTKFTSGLSGSLTQLVNGTSYLAAGANITITSASNGQITIASTATGGGAGPTFFNSTTAGSIFTSGSAAFVGGQSSPAAPDAPKDIGNDVFFFVSGSVDSRGTAVTGTAVFGGDMAISGTLAVNLSDAAVGSQFVVTTDGKVGIGTSTPGVKLSVGGNMEVGEFINHKNDSDTFIRFQDDDIEIEAGGRAMIKMSEGSADQVLIMSGGGATSLNPASFTDTNLFVSGTIGSQGTSTAGTSVFGGDVVVSGALDAKQGVGTLKTSTSVVHISASNAPTSGSVLVAKSSTEAAWQQAIVFGEQPSGTKNGINLSFNLANAVINNTDLMLFVNGLLQLSGSSNDYTLTGSQINFNSGLAPFSEDVITAIYRPST